MLKQSDAMLMGIPRASGGDPRMIFDEFQSETYSPRKRG